MSQALQSTSGLAPSGFAPSGAAPGVALRGAGLTYGDRVLFRGLDLDLEAGRTTCLLGPSGVGKTSLLRLIAGLAGDGGGRVVGRAADGDGRPVADRVAYMAQQDLLLPWLTVARNTLLGARLRGEARDPAQAEKARTLLEALGLTGAADALPAALSGGMRQRAALARTLMEDRPLVLMDEPFAALDAITKVDLQGLAVGLLRGRTVLLITHDPLEALRLGHRVLVMAGRPATLEDAAVPAGDPPRDLSDPTLLALQGALLARLAEARGRLRAAA